MNELNHQPDLFEDEETNRLKAEYKRLQKLDETALCPKTLEEVRMRKEQIMWILYNINKLN